MIWKTLGLLVVMWIAYIVINWLVHMVLPLVVLGVIVGGGYLVYKAVRKSKARNITRF